MTNNSKLEFTSNYLPLLDLAFDVAQSIKGKKTTDHIMPDCQQLALKLYMHAATIYHLRQGTKAPVPKSVEEGTNFFDFSSAAVLTRAAIETYLTLFEVFFEPVSADEREFRYLLWILSGVIIREKYDPNDPSLSEQVLESKKLIANLRKRLQATKRFSTLSSRQQNDVLKGKRMTRNWEDVAKAANFNKEFIRRIYAYYSGYTHSDGLSGIQIVTAKTRDQQIQMFELHMAIVMILLSKMIINYYDLFPESKKACIAKLETFLFAREIINAPMIIT
jgi:hypothetical protein